jgi:hypothetical protein
MMREAPHNLSPGIELETAYYLTDPQIFEEYERLRDAAFRAESTLTHLWRNPKFQRRVLQWSRLGIFAILVWAGISTITHLRLWNDIYSTIITAL